MPIFRFKAVDAHGVMVRGRMSALSIGDLEERLTRNGCQLIDSRPTKGNGFGYVCRGASKRRALIDFCFHLEQYLHAGVPLLDALDDLQNGLESSVIKQLSAQIADDIRAGKTLSEALALHPNIFDDIFIGLIRAGEASGRLTDVIHGLAEMLKEQDELVQRNKQLLLYPALALIIISAAIAFLMLYVVPQLIPFLQSMGTEMPAHTRLLIALTEAISRYGIALLLLPVILAGLSTTLVINPRWMSYRFDRWKLRLWLIGPILEKIIAARLMACMAMMYRSGIPVLDSLKMCENVTGNLWVKEALLQARDSIQKGQGIAAGFERTRAFAPLVIRFLRVGETTGQLDNALYAAAYCYKREVRQSLERLQIFIEPCLTLTLGLLLGWIMLAVLNPIYDVVGRVKL